MHAHTRMQARTFLTKHWPAVTKYASDSAIADFAKRRAMPTGKSKVDAPLTTRLRATRVPLRALRHAVFRRSAAQARAAAERTA